MKKVCNAYDPQEAYIIKGILESEGIEADVQDDQLHSLVGGVGYTEAIIPTVWIFDDTKYDEAYTILEEYEKKKNKSISEVIWICSSCKEESTEAFTECWNCGERR